MSRSPRSTALRSERCALEPAGASAALLTLTRPECLNAIDGEMLAALDAAIDEIDADDSVRCILVTGEGRAFSAGGDLQKYIELQRDAGAAVFPAHNVALGA